MSEISLDAMDGYQFQKFIASLFQKLGFSNVKVGPAGADKGIDISMEQITSLGIVRYIVECKHHAEGTIGRPVVQKLHSAIMTNAANKGIIVTSGYFSGEAIQYAENVGIELIDTDKLEELAKKAGMSIQKKSSLSLENFLKGDLCFPISEKAKVISMLYNFLKNDLVGFEEKFLRIEEISLRLLSSYMIDYTINATFSTSVGLIHSINEKSSIFLDGENEQLLNPLVTDPLVPLRYGISQLDEKSVKDVGLLKKGEFVRSFKDIKESSIEILRRMHTKVVSYFGANNRRYFKKCVPHKRDITITDVKRVYLPIWSIGFSILKNKYVAVATESVDGLNVLPANLTQVPASSSIKVYPDNCMICSKELDTGAYLCSVCGAIVCHKDQYECKVCRKVICKNDVISKRRFLVLSDKYCPGCAPKQVSSS